MGGRCLGVAGAPLDRGAVEEEAPLDDEEAPLDGEEAPCCFSSSSSELLSISMGSSGSQPRVSPAGMHQLGA